MNGVFSELSLNFGQRFTAPFMMLSGWGARKAAICEQR